MLDTELYGGKRGYLEHIRTRVWHALGAYNRALDIEWGSIRRLVFVCKGNICRSPYATGRARLLGAPAVSFGIETSVGNPADPAASKNALLRGVDLSAHRTARLESSRIAIGDLVIGFEPGQLAEIRRRSSICTPAVSLLGLWAHPNRPYIHDPYGRTDRYFQQCLSVIDANVAQIVGRMSVGRVRSATDDTVEMRIPTAIQQNSCGRLHS